MGAMRLVAGFFILCVVTLVASWLTGCSSSPQAVEVQVPVAVPCPVPPPVARPTLAVGTITEKATPDEVVKAQAASLEQCMGYAEELEVQLNGYRKR